ncbi:ribonuclease R [uncultured Porphyromonas sp.]|uniref:ribonuclease R n=1 Tax=uncultured Porphyromonas sp. TaxID=159274 RepID=UPI00280421A4|nr:ribonuclease R [uncultured Porphyromonas sp.]
MTKPSRKKNTPKKNPSKRSKAKQLNLDELTRAVVKLFAANPTHTWNYKQVSKQLDITEQPMRLTISRILDVLAMDDTLTRVKPGTYRYNLSGALLFGTFERRSNGRNAVISDEDGKSIFIAERNAMHALNGDRVQARLFAKRQGGELEAEVINIIERSKHTFVGRLEFKKDWAIFVTEDRTLSTDILIPLSELHGAQRDSKVEVAITDWPSSDKIPTGRVLKVLGKAGDNDTEMRAILTEYNIDYDYPQAAIDEAERLSGEITQEQLAQREDFREVPTLTIDPADAKDFDDALSYRDLGDGRHEVGVHIADVSYFVTEGSKIDEEAYARGTSVYLVDRTIPMLPEVLCNNLCSLRPNEDKYAYSCILTLDNAAHVQQYRICRTVIRSDQRMTYEEAQDVIEGRSDTQQAIIQPLFELSQQLRKRRFDDGAIKFQSQEVRFTLDPKGRPTGVEEVVDNESHHLIEEFMLLANRTVAEDIGQVRAKGKKAKNFVYRVHAQPSEEKLMALASFVGKFGYKVNLSGENRQVSRSFNKLLDSVQGKREENLIETLAIRSMTRAEYSPDNIGHYGLSFAFYTHFTSPIRRYPDLMVHRLLTRYYAGGRSVTKGKLEEQCQHCSEQEQIATQAERDSVKYKQVEYMKARMGQVFDGVISGVAEWGLYVELKGSHCEGLIPIRKLEDDYFEYDEKNYRLRGRRTGKRYNLGDPITVRVARADLEQRQLDFDLV